MSALVKKICFKAALLLVLTAQVGYAQTIEDPAKEHQRMEREAEQRRQQAERDAEQQRQQEREAEERRQQEEREVEQKSQQERDAEQKRQQEHEAEQKIPQVMTMTTAKEGEVKISLRGSGTATISWGDGTPNETVKLTNNSSTHNHRYIKSVVRTIIITGVNITHLSCGSNQLTSLDVSRNLQLAYLSCYSNQLTNLDVSRNVQLAYLDCYSNQLTNLDVSRNVQLTRLECGRNRLTRLDVSRNIQLTYLSCSSNQLTSLDVSRNTSLKTLFCSNNRLKADALNTLFGSLHRNVIADKTIYINNNPGTRNARRSIATNKGWTFK